MRYGFVIDNKRCIGCHACSTACKSENEVPLGVNRTWVKYTETGRFPDVRRHFQVTRCNHCENPPCVAICPVSAMYQRTDGIVEFDGDRCIGCKACIQACPYDAIYLDPATQTAAKCHYCAHRIDVGLEPACVVVCPEHAIIAGDMDDPASEISRYLGKESVMVRKPEQGTKPKLFYVDGHAHSLVPTAVAAGPMMWADAAPDGLLVSPGRVASQMVQVGYNAQHKAYWRWPVAAYIVTKDIAAGLIILIAAAYFAGFATPGVSLVSSLISLCFLAVTSLFLVFDLAKPSRFLFIVFKPQWRSWLARGAFILMGFSGLVTLLSALLALNVLDLFKAPAPIFTGLLALLLPLGFLTSAYTAFLFGQAEGRDLWQHPLLPLQFCVRAVLAGSATLLAVSPFFSHIDPGNFLVFTFDVFFVALLIDLSLTLFAEFAMPHATDVARVAAHDILQGRYRNLFWGGYIVIGHVVPLGLFFARFHPAGLSLMGITALVGLACMEFAFVLAPQRVPNS